MDTQIHKNLGMDLLFQTQKGMDLDLDLTKLNEFESKLKGSNPNPTHQHA